MNLCVFAFGAAAQSGGPMVAVVDDTPDLLIVYRQAKAHSADYRAALAEYQAAREAGDQARAQLLPKLKAGAGYSRVRQEISGSLLGIQSIHEDDYFDSQYYGVTFTQPIFDRSAFVGLDLADLKLKRAQLKLKRAKNELRIQAAITYFGLLAAKDSLKLARAKKKAIKRQLEQTTDRFKSGLTSKAKVKAARAQYFRTKADVMAARNKVAITQTKLEALTGQHYDDVRELPEDAQLPPLKPNRMDAWVTQAVHNSVRLLIETISAHIAKLRIDQIQGKRWPDLDLVASYSYSEQNGGFFDAAGSGGTGGATETTDARIGVRLTMTLYNGGLISSRVSQARAEYNRARAEQNDRRAQVIQNTRSAFLNLQTALAQRTALQQAVQAAKAAKQAALVGLDVGTSTPADVLRAVQELYRAKRDLASVRYDYLVNFLKLKRVAGSLNDRDLKKINKRLR